MKLEGLVTCLDYFEAELEGESGPLINLIGVFQRLDKPPIRFVVYFDVQPGAEDAAVVIVRLRRATMPREMIFEAVPELLPVYGQPCSISAWVEDVELPMGKLVLEVLIDGRIAGSRLIQFGP